MKRIFTIIVFTFVFGCFFAMGSEAGVKKIRPDTLKPHLTAIRYYQTARKMHALGPEQYFIADVKLPVGKRITKLEYYHSGVHTSVSLFRTKMGESSEELAAVDCTDNSTEIVTAETADIDYPLIKSGYKYYVWVMIDNSHSNFYGIKIFYK